MQSNCTFFWPLSSEPRDCIVAKLYNKNVSTLNVSKAFFLPFAIFPTHFVKACPSLAGSAVTCCYYYSFNSSRDVSLAILWIYDAPPRATVKWRVFAREKFINLAVGLLRNSSFKRGDWA